MKSIFIFIFIFISISLFAQKSDSLLLNKIIQMNDYSNARIDSLLNETASINKKIEVNDKPWLEKNGSWIAAIIIGFLTVLANILINYQVRKSNVITAKMQIENAKNIAIKQINGNTIIAFRQKWIENLRDCIAEYISIASYVYLKVHKRNDRDDSTVVEAFKQYSMLREKVKLYLNTEEIKHQNIIKSMSKISRYLYDEKLSAKEREEFPDETANLTNITKEVLKEEWIRIKSESI